MLAARQAIENQRDVQVERLDIAMEYLVAAAETDPEAQAVVDQILDYRIFLLLEKLKDPILEKYGAHRSTESASAA